MGTWSASINGNDTAQDLITEYRIAFVEASATSTA